MYSIIPINEHIINYKCVSIYHFKGDYFSLITWNFILNI